MAAHQLVVDAGGDVGDREAPLLLGDRGVELDLVQQVAELLDQRLVGGRVVGVERLEGVDQLECLLDEVRHERIVGLLAVPRALLAQRAGELVEAHVAGADRHAERRYVDAREVIRLDGAVELAPRGAGDRSAGVPRPCRITTGSSPVASSTASLISDSTWRSWVWAIKHRPGRAGGCHGELVAVDETHGRLDGVDAEPGPGDVEERHRRKHVAAHPTVGEQRAHRAFEDEW